MHPHVPVARGSGAADERYARTVGAKPFPIRWSRGDDDAPSRDHLRTIAPIERPDDEDWRAVYRELYRTHHGTKVGGRPSVIQHEAGTAGFIARGVLLTVVEPNIALLPGCSTQCAASGRRIPLVVYGTTTFDATAVTTAATVAWNMVTLAADFVDDVNSDGADDWIGHFPADDVALGAGSTAFGAKLASSRMVLGPPAVTFGTVGDTDADGLDNDCDQCPSTYGTGAYGCP